MNKAYEYAVKYATDTESAKSYAEYYDKVIYKYTDIINAIQDAVNDPSLSNDDIISQYTASKISANSKIIINDQCFKLDDFLTGVKQSVITADGQIDSDSLTSIDIPITIQNLDGNAISYNTSDLFNNINAVLHAACVDQAVAQAYYLTSNTAERLQIVRDAIAAKFSSAYTDVSNTLNYAVEKVKSGASFGAYIKEKLIANNINGIINNGTITVGNEEISYTGSSSVIAALEYAADDIVGGVLFVIKAMGATLQALWNGIIKGVSNLWQKFISWGVTHTINPVEVGVYDGADGTFTFDKFYHTTEVSLNPSTYAKLYNKLLQGPLHMDFVTGEYLIQLKTPSPVYVAPTTLVEGFSLFANYYHDYVSTSFDLSGLTGIIYNDITYIIEELGGNSFEADNIEEAIVMLYELYNTGASYTYTTALKGVQDLCLSIYNRAVYEDAIAYVMFKPKTIDFNRMVDIDTEDAGTGYAYYKIALEPALDQIYDNPDVYYITDEEDNNRYIESRYYRSLMYSVTLSNLLMSTLDPYNWSAENNYRIVIPYDLDHVINKSTSDGDNTAVTNKDFVDLLVNGKYIYQDSVTHQTETINVDFDTSSEAICKAINAILTYQDANVDGAYFPYTTKMVEWNRPSYYVLTDAQAQTIVNTFVSRAILVIIVSLVAFAALRKLKNSAMKAFLKEQGALWNCTEAASKNSLTLQDVKAYKKAKLRAAMLNGLTGNLLAPASALVGHIADFSSGEINDNNNIIKLIRGF